MSVLSRLGTMIGRALVSFGLGASSSGSGPTPTPSEGAAGLPTHVRLLSPPHRRVRLLSPAHRKVRVLG